MIDIPQSEVDEAERFYRRLAHMPRLNPMSRCQIWLLRRFGGLLVRLAPSPTRKLGLKVRTTRIEAGGHSVGVRIIEPTGSPRGIVVDIHGGAWTILSAVHDDPRTAPMAAEGFVTVSVDYRYAPDVPFAAVIDDCEAALIWALDEGADAYGLPDVFLHGDSSGAHLAMAAALRQKNKGGHFGRLKGMVLFFGCYDLSATPSVRGATADTLALYGPTLGAFFERVTGGRSEADRRDPSISPLYAEVGGLPPVLLVVGTADPLLDDTVLMGDRLQQNNVKVEVLIIPNAPHAFNRFPLKLAERANKTGRQWMLDNIDLGNRSAANTQQGLSPS